MCRRTVLTAREVCRAIDSSPSPWAKIEDLPLRRVQRVVRLRGAEGDGPLPQHLEVFAERADDHRRPDEKRARQARHRQRQQRDRLVRQLHLHHDARQQPGLLALLDGQLDRAQADRVFGAARLVDAPAPDLPVEGRERCDDRQLVDRPFHELVVERQPVAVGSADQAARQALDLFAVGDDLDEAIDARVRRAGSGEPRLGHPAVAAQQALLVGGEPAGDVGQRSLQRQFGSDRHQAARQRRPV